MKKKINIRLYILLAFILLGLMVYLGVEILNEKDEYEYSSTNNLSNDTTAIDDETDESNEINEYRSKIEEYSYLIDEISNENEILKSAYDVNSDEIQILIDKINKAYILIEDLKAPNQFINEHNELLNANEEMKNTVETFYEAIEFDDTLSLSNAVDQLEIALNKIFDPLQPIANYIE